MALVEEFEQAQKRVQNLKSRPSTTELLDLYALYKQGTAGDVSGSRPGALDFKGRAKYDAWSQRKGMTKDDAMKSYVSLVEKLGVKYG